MPRPLRIEYPGAVYHVMCRGNRGGTVIETDGDALLFLDTLEEMARRSGFEIHAYCLMQTHYHLLAATPNGNLVQGMKWFQGAFTQRMNSRKKQRGHLFAGRYKAKVMDSGDPEYFRTAGDYIHLNPAGLLTGEMPDLAEYRMSSFVQYIQPPGKRSPWLHTERLLSAHGMADTPKGRAAFHALMNSKALSTRTKDRRLDGEERNDFESGWVHGNAEFRKRMILHLQEGLNQKPVQTEDFQQKHEISEDAARDAIEKGSRHLKIRLRDLPQMKKSAVEKKMLAALLKKHFEVSNRWISEQLFMGHISQAGNVMRWLETTPAPLKEKFARLEKIL